MSQQNRRTFLKAAGSASVVALAGCTGDGGEDTETEGMGGDDTTSSGDDHDDDHGDTTDSEGGTDTLTLGGTMSLSGDNADLGKLYEQAYETTIAKINEQGGIEAGDGNTYELEMVLRDDETDASKSKTIYQELIDREGIDYLLGPYSSTVTLPASAVAAQNQKPMVEGGGASPKIFSQGNEWIFGLLPTANKYALSAIDMAMAQDPTPSTAALLVQDDTFSQSTAKGVRNKISNTDGLSLAVDETFPSGTSDLSTNLGKVRSADADILLLAAHQKHAIIMAKQMESQQVNVDMAMATVGSLNTSFKDETGQNGDYIMGPSSWAINADFEDPVYGSTSNFASAIENKYDNSPDYHSAAGESVILTFKKAFETVDEVTPMKVRNAIRDVEFTTAYGNVAFDDKGIIDKEMLVYQWQPEADAKQIVWPEAVQQSAPVYPMPSWSDR
jgi:branched-chain amino acid transport system substrate-binding protein